jgi:hypothetical protein
MVSSTIINQIANSFKSFQKSQLYTELKESPKASSWIIEDLDMYDDMIGEYKKVEYSQDISYVEYDLNQLIDENPKLEFTNDNKLQLAKQVAKANIEVLQDIKQEFKDGIYSNSYKEPTISEPIQQEPISEPKATTSSHPINNIFSKTNSVAINQSSSNTIKDKFNEWLVYKETVDKISKSSIKDYKSAYRHTSLHKYS